MRAIEKVVKVNEVECAVYEAEDTEMEEEVNGSWGLHVVLSC